MHVAMTIGVATRSVISHRGSAEAAAPDIRSILGPGEAARERRVCLLLLATLLMSMTDLLLTLTYMKSVGMMEANPIARAMIAIGGVGQLVRFKLFTIALSCGILYILRRHKAAERCAWICCVAMVALSLHWVRYNDAVLAHGPPDPALLNSENWFVYIGD